MLERMKPVTIERIAENRIEGWSYTPLEVQLAQELLEAREELATRGIVLMECNDDRV